LNDNKDESSNLVSCWFSLGGQSECDQCPAGSSCNSTHSQLCPDNYVSPLGVADCTTCPHGNLYMIGSLTILLYYV